MNKTRLIATFSLPMLLGACQGITLQEIRAREPIYSHTSTRTLNAVLDCFATELDQFRGDGRMLMLTYPQGARAEFSLGSIQTGTFKHFYLVSLAGSSAGTRTEIKRAPSRYPPLAQPALIGIATRCTTA